MNSRLGRPRTNIRANLRASTIDGSCYNIMMGAGEANIVVFALALGFGERFAAVLGAAPLLGGAILQLLSPWCIRKLGSHKRWLHISAFAQALAFVPLIIAAVVGSIPGSVLLLIATLYWGACFAAGSTWNTYIGVSTPERLHAKYFAFRNRVLNLWLVVSTAIAGASLHFAKAHDLLLPVFALLFGVAALARGGSWYYTRLQTEPVPIPPGFRAVSWSELLNRYRHGPGGRLIVYAICAQLALQVATPFLAPFMLEELSLKNNYAQYGVLAAWVLLAKVVALPMWGRLAHARGARTLLRVGGVIFIPLPLLWLVSDSFAWLLFVQTISGAALAAYELGVFLMLLRSLADHERTSVMSKYQVVSQTATVLGSLIGIACMTQFGHHWAGYAWVFGASAALRAAALPLLARVQAPADDKRGTERARLAVHPAGAAADEPVLPTMPSERETPAHDQPLPSHPSA